MNKLPGLLLLPALLFFYQNAMAQIPVSGYNHVALAVKDIEASAKFYRETVGLEPIPVPEDLKAIRSWFKIAPGQELHLLAGRTDPVANNDRNGAHYSWTIPDADPIEQYLLKIGLPYHRQQRFDGAWQIYITDPDGYVIELNEPKVIWQNLFNDQDLAGWDTYLGPQFPATGEDRTGIQPIGLNVDPKGTFSVVTEDGVKAIRISGEQFGGISTKDEFENYHLHLEFKWGKHKYHPKENAKMDSGVLYHANGEHGVDWGFWMQSQEFQIQEGDCGDYWGVAGAVMDVPVLKKGDKDWVFDPKGDMTTFIDNSAVGRHAIKNPDAERPTGAWNSIDLYCYGDTAIHVVNGKVVMVLYHSRRPLGNGFEPLTKGKIQLQSEGAEIFYKSIRITPITHMPEKLLQ
ncbi:MAG: family 16 glycoside hydrolase [Saprospiraceae bacterium]